MSWGSAGTGAFLPHRGTAGCVLSARGENCPPESDFSVAVTKMPDRQLKEGFALAHCLRGPILCHVALGLWASREAACYGCGKVLRRKGNKRV